MRVCGWVWIRSVYKGGWIGVYQGWWMGVWIMDRYGPRIDVRMGSGDNQAGARKERMAAWAGERDGQETC